MTRRPPRSTRPDTLLPDTTLFRSVLPPPPTQFGANRFSIKHASGHDAVRAAPPGLTDQRAAHGYRSQQRFSALSAALLQFGSPEVCKTHLDPAIRAPLGADAQAIAVANIADDA